MTKEFLIETLKGINDTYKLNKTEAEIIKVMDTLDIEGISKSARELYTVSIWDKTSKINGVDPSYILGQVPFTSPDWNGLTYLISKDNKVEIIQYDDFRVQGWQPITSEETAFELAEIQLIPMLEHVVVTEALTKLRGE